MSRHWRPQWGDRKCWWKHQDLERSRVWKTACTQVPASQAGGSVLPGSHCQAGWEVLPHQAPACCSCSVARQPHHPVPYKSRYATPACQPWKAPLPSTVSQHSSGEGPAIPPTLFAHLQQEPKLMATTTALALAQQTPLLQDHQDRKRWKNHSAKDAWRLCEPCTLDTLSPQGEEQVFCDG